MEPRDETKPRTTDTIHFLYEEEFNKIPRDILDEAADNGKKGHKIIELNWDTSLDHPIVNMFRQGLEKVRHAGGAQECPCIEKQINGLKFTGKPDFFDSNTVIDYKFTRDRLRPETAIQLVLYGELAAEFLCAPRVPEFYFAFHFHQDGGLFVYRIPDRAKEPLRKFGMSLVENHEAIKAGTLIRYEKMLEWERLQLEYDVFEIFYCTMPPMTVTSELEAKTAVLMFRDLQKVEGYTAHLKRELVRYMESAGVTKICDHTGGGVKIQVSNRKKHDAEKLKAYKATIVTGVEQSKSLVRFNPPKDKKQKRLT